MQKRTLAAALSLAVAITAPLAAQSVMGDMHRDVNEVQKKMIDLANAIPADKFNWRPAPGARSIAEVLLHITGENYSIPAFMGKAVPPSSGIGNGDEKAMAAFEARKVSKEQLIAELTTSFTNLHQGMGLTTDQNLGEMIKFFGQDWSRSRAMVLTVTHIHEHLGQLIAYARSNNVTPPWSR